MAEVSGLLRVLPGNDRRSLFWAIASDTRFSGDGLVGPGAATKKILFLEKLSLSGASLS